MLMMKDTIITKEVEEEVQDDNRNRPHQGGAKIFFPAGNRDHHRQNIQGQLRVQGHHQGMRPFIVVAHRLKGDLEELVLEAEVEVGEELKVRFQNVPKSLLNIQQMIRNGDVEQISKTPRDSRNMNRKINYILIMGISNLAHLY